MPALSAGPPGPASRFRVDSRPRRRGAQLRGDPTRNGRPADRHHRPRLRRPAARDRVRRGRPRGRWASTPTAARGRAAPRAARRSTTSPTSASRRRLDAAAVRGRRAADAHLADADVVFVCVPTPITTLQGPGPRAGPGGGRADPRAPPGRPARRPPVDDLPGHDDRARSARSSSERASSPARDFDLAFAPERVNPGDPASASKARAAPRRRRRRRRRRAAPRRSCGSINDHVIELSSPDAAELAKLLENVFRNVNIALVNQLALLCERMGLDVWEVIDAAATKPFGFMRFTPGPGRRRPLHPGRPVLPRRGGPASSTSSTASSSWPATSTSRCRATSSTSSPRRSTSAAGRSAGPRVGVLGVAFKPNVRDARNSPAADVIAGLADARRGGRLSTTRTCRRFRDAAGARPRLDGRSTSPRTADVVVVVTAHRAIDLERGLRARRTSSSTPSTARGRAADRAWSPARQVLRPGRQRGWASATGGRPERAARLGWAGPASPQSGPSTSSVGARPNFMKAAPVDRGAGSARGVASSSSTPASTTTRAMSDVFFRELGAARSRTSTSASARARHAAQTAALMVALEEAFWSRSIRR